MRRLVITTFLAFSFLILTGSCSKDFLSESDKKALFATPSGSEIDEIVADWKKRDLKPADYLVEEQHALFGGRFTLKMVSYKIAGFKQYSALLIPQTSSKVPVRMYISGFGLDVTTNSVDLVLDTAAAATPFILAIPALRGQSLTIKINGTLYSSPLSQGEHCDAFDGGTDDAIGLLNVIEQTETIADVERTSVRGGSRGATVALLTGIRDPRVKRVVGVAGPTDMVELTSVSENDATYQCQFLSGVKGNPAELARARKRLIASSPLFFAKYLPLAQLHMGTNDKKVPVSQGQTLKDAIIQLGNGARFELFNYERTHEDIATNNSELASRIDRFLSLL